MHSVDALEQHEAELKASVGLWRRGDVIVGEGLRIPGLVVEDGVQQVTDANELFFELCVSLALPPQADRILKARACFKLIWKNRGPIVLCTGDSKGL